ncbi:MAG: ABC transporter permease [Sphaerochaetaceae bacterium]|nr:ABC transporter permease [Sphaerochaetaceae bacterium]
MEQKIRIGHIEVVRREQRVASLFGMFSSLIAIFLALVAGGVVMAVVDINPFTAYGHLFAGAFASKTGCANTLIKTTPLLIAGLGLSISFRCNLINIGAEGQMIVGGIAATAVALYLPVSSPLLMFVFIFLAGFLAGGFWGAVPGILKAKFGISEIINTIMLNYIAIHVLSFMLDGPLREPDNYYPQSAKIAQEFWLAKILDGTRLHAGFLIALVLVLFYYLLFYRLPQGFRIRTVGYNPKAARYAGMSVSSNVVLAMFLSGAFAGIAGMSEILGMHHRLYNEFTSGYGFDAISIALLGKLHPLGVVLAALFFGALRVGANAMQHVVQIPIAIVYVIQGLAVLFILTDTFFRTYILTSYKRKGLKRRKRA